MSSLIVRFKRATIKVVNRGQVDINLWQSLAYNRP